MRIVDDCRLQRGGVDVEDVEQGVGPAQENLPGVVELLGDDARVRQGRHGLAHGARLCQQTLPRDSGSRPVDIPIGIQRDGDDLFNNVSVRHPAVRPVARAAVDDVAVDAERAVVEIPADDHDVGLGVGVDGQRQARRNDAHAVAAREMGGPPDRETVLAGAARRREVSQDDGVEVRGEVRPPRVSGNIVRMGADA